MRNSNFALEWSQGALFHLRDLPGGSKAGRGSSETGGGSAVFCLSFRGCCPFSCITQLSLSLSLTGRNRHQLAFTVAAIRYLLISKQTLHCIWLNLIEFTCSPYSSSKHPKNILILKHPKTPLWDVIRAFVVHQMHGCMQSWQILIRKVDHMKSFHRCVAPASHSVCQSAQIAR